MKPIIENTCSFMTNYDENKNDKVRKKNLNLRNLTPV